MSDRREIVLPYDLYHRIRISSEEHGGIGRGPFFEDGCPNCAHGHAWGTEQRFKESGRFNLLWRLDPSRGEEPELARYLSGFKNDDAVLPYWVDRIVDGLHLPINTDATRISFEKWCRRLNVKCGPKQGEGVDQPRQALGTLGRVATPEPAGAL